ncbi:MAG: phosphotransferase family protein [Acidimicrobiia bacterium]|nr:MAG: phosphotransferase family protein [Acidimicrobiia bacterium]
MIDTAPIRREERFDEDRVAAYLVQELPDLVGQGPIEFAQFPGGAANLTYLAKSPQIELVLRRAPLGVVARGGHDMEREFRVLSRLWSVYPLAPRAYHYCSDPEVLGKAFFVMERCHGHVIRSDWPSRIADDRAGPRRVAEGLIDGLARLHLVDPEAADLGDLGHPDGFVERQISGWSRRWEAAKTREIPDMERARALLGTGLPTPQAVTILHNDYKLDNTMVDDDGKLVAVFDWDMATRGDPLVDLGTLLSYWPDPESPTYPIFGERSVALAPYLAKKDAAERYRRTTSFDLSSVGYYEGLALFRIAVIIEQIYARYAAGQTTDARFAQFEPIPRLLAAAAVAILGG